MPQREILPLRALIGRLAAVSPQIEQFSAMAYLPVSLTQLHMVRNPSMRRTRGA